MKKKLIATLSIILLSGCALTPQQLAEMKARTAYEDAHRCDGPWVCYQRTQNTRIDDIAIENMKTHGELHADN